MQGDNDMLATSSQGIRGGYSSSGDVETMIHDDGLSDDPSSPDSSFDATDLMHHEDVHHDDVTSQLAASGKEICT